MSSQLLTVLQICLLILLYLFNPILTSLRGLQQASELAKVPGSHAEQEELPATEK